MKDFIRRFAISLSIVATFSMPYAVGALSAEDMRGQISALLQQVSQLQQQIRLLQASSTVQIINPESSRHRICKFLNRNLAQGVHGDDVQSLQEFLSEQGHFNGSTTGFFGPRTAEAVARWQAQEGVSAVGSIGPRSRERIKTWCADSDSNTNACKPINYMAPLCSDGSASQPMHNQKGCITGYECPVANFTPPAMCQSWNDGCNECARQSPDTPAACTMRACFAAGKGYCKAYFDESGSPVPDGGDVVCTAQYVPVCGQPPEPACRHSNPACMIATPGRRTYGNRCEMNAAGAIFISEGQCVNSL